MESKILGGRYELLEKIGEGGMATVYKARCTVLERIVAVKILKDEFKQDNSFVEKFKTEALAAARISHPNIVSIYDVGQDNDIHYIVMEYVDGNTLKDLILEEKILDINKAISIAIMICDGVQFAHENGVIHRDIKPHNILITSQGMVKVADFGIAKAISNSTITFGDNIVGSVHYISPEQARGLAAEATTDIYSIGCVLYEMVTGKVPFDADSPITVALKHIHDEPVAPSLVNNKVPTNLENIIKKAMAKLPAYRFSSAEEMRNNLLRLPDNDSINTLPGQNGKTLVIPREKITNIKKSRRIKPAGKILIAIALIAFFTGILSVTGINFFGEEVVVPDIVDMPIKDADVALKEKGLVINVIAHQTDEKIKKDHIISQEPVKDSRVKKGREIKVVVSDGQELVRVPDLKSLSLSDANVRLQNAGLKSGNPDERYDDKYGEGLIISQYPESGQMVNPGSKVDLMVSKGKQPEKVKVISLVGLNYETAVKKLEGSGLVAGEVIKQDSTKYYSGQVISQDIQPGVLIEQGSTVILTISKGPGPTAKTHSLEIKLPGTEEYYKVQIKVNDQQGSREVYNQLHTAKDDVNVGITYYGTGTYQIILNGKVQKTGNLK